MVSGLGFELGLELGFGQQFGGGPWIRARAG